MKKMVWFALVAMAILLMGASKGVMAPETDPRGKPPSFRVFIDKEPVYNIIAIENLGVEIMINEIPPEKDNIVRAEPGFGRPTIVKFTGIATEDTRLRDWALDVFSGKKIYKKITVKTLDDQEKIWNLIMTFPTAFNYTNIAEGADAGAVQHWTLEVRAQRIEKG
jgi:hypothetical protein